MLCPLCNVEMVIGSGCTKVEGDDSPDTPTRVYVEHTLVCTTPHCTNYDRVVDVRRVDLV